MKKQAKQMNENILAEEEATSLGNCSISNTSNESDESAWTLYLQPSSSSREMIACSCDHDSDQSDDVEEDLSMVSDASSGPPHDLDVEIVEYQSCKKRKSQCLLPHDFALDDVDDTASSPLYFPSTKYQKKLGSISDNNVRDEEDLCSLHSYIRYLSSQRLSVSHFQGRSSLNFQDVYGFADQSIYSTEQIISTKPVM